MKELHSCEQVQSWAKLRMMDWALSGLQLVLGGNKWSGRHAEYTTLASETPMLEHLGNLLREKWHTYSWTKDEVKIISKKSKACCFNSNVHILVTQKQ